MKNEMEEVYELIYLLKRIVELDELIPRKNKEITYQEELQRRRWQQANAGDSTELNRYRAGECIQTLRNEHQFLLSTRMRLQRRLVNKLQKSKGVKKLIEEFGTKALQKDIVKMNKENHEDF